MPPKHGHHGQHAGQHSSGTSYGGGSSGSGFDFSSIESFASQHAGSTGDSSMFSSAMGMLSGKQSQLANEDVDEQHMVNAHQSFFGNGDASGATSGGIGAASAMQALKMFSGGSSSSSSGGSSQNEFVGMAMGQAAKLFGESCVTTI